MEAPTGLIDDAIAMASSVGNSAPSLNDTVDTGINGAEIIAKALWYGSKATLSYAAGLSKTLFYIAAWPVAVFYSILSVLLAPIVIPVQRGVQLVGAVVGTVAPIIGVLYIYLGVAAIIGIIAGVCCAFISLGIDRTIGTDEPDTQPPPRRVSRSVSGRDEHSQDDSLEDYSQESDFANRREQNLPPITIRNRGAAAAAASSSSRSKRKVPGLLVSETIHEEEDSSD
ncbi:hypothetical protein B0T17DRAFT_45321 [Bombardia bombarda]|uniref:Uncharacterized protein n=1 Tax=Bombardia bombarda TaxID=252184 RepID=A0AA39XM13_9PEZI|nr:hypothetical protein B0T17DRAFT_45321 [Bombardia bombarda]